MRYSRGPNPLHCSVASENGAAFSLYPLVGCSGATLTGRSPMLYLDSSWRGRLVFQRVTTSEQRIEYQWP